jgi:DNA-binding transcriptional LysR family regulator
MDKFDAMQMFVRVVEKGSFSAVAKERGIGQPAVSKQISALEHNLGAELIHRTSRSIILTEAGREFYESALHILDDFENATSRIAHGQSAPKGLIRVTVPPTFARLHMVSKPESPEDVSRFRSVVFVERGSAQPWKFGSGQDVKPVIPTGVFRTSDIEQMRMGVLEHLGIAQAPAWLFAAELREGTVLRLLTPFERTVPILAVRPASRRMSAKVRVFIEHLEKTFALCSQFNPR